jgi:hypothetical protein
MATFSDCIGICGRIASDFIKFYPVIGIDYAFPFGCQAV